MIISIANDLMCDDVSKTCRHISFIQHIRRASFTGFILREQNPILKDSCN